MQKKMSNEDGLLALILSSMEGYSYDRIASIFNCSPPTVSRAIGDAINQVKFAKQEIEIKQLQQGVAERDQIIAQQQIPMFSKNAIPANGCEFTDNNGFGYSQMMNDFNNMHQQNVVSANSYDSNMYYN
ncbi:MAG: sigma-70 region 4 domain-containing protein, partial [Oscillospiraceae bacterium]|nr:sigma-70 region 4 domain-containing protein [Oscillospiraceae bacterium]